MPNRPVANYHFRPWVPKLAVAAHEEVPNRRYDSRRTWLIGHSSNTDPQWRDFGNLGETEVGQPLDGADRRRSLLFVRQALDEIRVERLDSAEEHAICGAWQKQ